MLVNVITYAGLGFYAVKAVPRDARNIIKNLIMTIKNLIQPRQQPPITKRISACGSVEEYT